MRAWTVFVLVHKSRRSILDHFGDRLARTLGTVTMGNSSSRFAGRNAGNKHRKDPKPAGSKPAKPSTVIFGSELSPAKPATNWAAPQSKKAHWALHTSRHMACATVALFFL